MIETKYIKNRCDTCKMSTLSGENRICPETKVLFTTCCGGNPSMPSLITRYNLINEGVARCPLGLNVKTIENERNTNT